MKTLTKSREACEIMRRHKPVIVFDTETTGTSVKTDRIIEFSGDYYEWDAGTKRYKKTDSLELYIKPPYPVSKDIEGLTGITNAFLEDKEEESVDCLLTILEFLFKGYAFAGHNAKTFDVGMINGLAKRQSMWLTPDIDWERYPHIKRYLEAKKQDGKDVSMFEYMQKHAISIEFSPKFIIDTLYVARELIDKDELRDRSYKLCNVAEYYKVSSGGFHNATNDIQNTWDVLVAEMKDYRRQEKERKKADLKTNFSIRSMSRYKKVYGKTRRIDRMYVKTSLGEVVYEMESGDVYPKEPGGPNVDPAVLTEKMDAEARRMGYNSFSEVKPKQ